MVEEWTPNIDDRKVPLYRAIADAIERDVADRVLRHGTQMPTHRALADRLGVNVATVTRAYSEARLRGLLVGEVGRGTYVSNPSASSERATTESGIIDFRINQPPTSEVEKALSRELAAFSGRVRTMGLLGYHQAPGKLQHRIAGSKWVERAGVFVEPGRVVLTNGAQQALMATFAVLTQPGDLVVTEALTYPGIRSLADLFRVRLRGLRIDDQGLVPDSLEEVCREEKPAALYLTPTIHNPTASVLPLERRQEIARIAERYQVPIVEDDIYGPLTAGNPAPIFTMATGDCYYVCGTSKTVAPGLRIGYLVAPSHMIHYVANAVHATTWSAPPLTAEIVTSWIESGIADRVLEWHRAESGRRQAAARRILGQFDITDQPFGYHLWLRLPEEWRSEDFVQAARANGVAIAPSSPFAVDPRDAPRAVRISLGLPENQALMEEGLMRINDTLSQYNMPKNVII
ncbi:PLP-dependent aminotransferase family protein [Limibacillus halophilus]|uniref:DNA-binding transcriptional MocR family regulator n=1 Tax=Limibacillus halophilus TaxID=1579333 RepID=A0A839SR78_9PROT|nr:PLP-dependent aminotransferase family protein [Limibacillus halophilus]MBB3064240.1 DNA-binding transcriptional MocR family regulator [Limibacillus halophilus]